MAEEQKNKTLTREILLKQVEESKAAIGYAQSNIQAYTEQLQQQRGVLKYAEHILAQFDVPEATKPEKPSLEVK